MTPKKRTRWEISPAPPIEIRNFFRRVAFDNNLKTTAEAMAFVAKNYRKKK